MEKEKKEEVQWQLKENQRGAEEKGLTIMFMHHNYYHD